MPSYAFHHRLPKNLVRRSQDPSPDHDLFGIQNIQKIRDPDPEVVTGSLIATDRELIPFARSHANLPGAYLFISLEKFPKACIFRSHPFANVIRDRSPGGVCLKASLFPAITFPAFGDDTHVSDLPGHKTGAFVKLPVNNDPAPDSRANSEINKIRGSSSLTEQIFPQGRSVRIVGKTHGKSCFFFQNARQRKPLPSRKIGRPGKDPFPGIHSPGTTDTDPQDLFERDARLLGEISKIENEFVDAGLGSRPGPRRDLTSREDLPLFSPEYKRDLCPANINSDRIFHRSDNLAVHRSLCNWDKLL